jgi:magnesium-transporting ATPase (P-type)
LRLRSKLTANASTREIARWACIAGVAYLVYWWITYFGQWIATFLQPSSYATTYPGYGIGYLLNYPLNIFTFVLTAVGLPLLIVFFYWTSRGAIKGTAQEFRLRNIGIVLTLLGAYFITIVVLFHIFGSVGGSSIWIIFFMFNNPDLWCITLLLVGIPLILAKPKVRLQ